ncbi:MAG: hypothetical protein JNN28_01420 [Saprospiraceae bacterium]|nr:hypothetical protein [Saprospiraceae bacterium]
MELIQVLNPEEVAGFQKYLDTRFPSTGTSRKHLKNLFNLIEAERPEFSDDKLNIKYLYICVYGNEKHVKGKLDKAMTELAQHIRNYIIFQENQKSFNIFAQWLQWSIWLRAKGLEERYQKAVEKMEYLLLQSPVQDISYFQKRLLLEQEKHEQLGLANQKRGDVNLPSVLKFLDINYQLLRLEYLNRLQLQQKVTILQLDESVNPQFIHPEIPQTNLDEIPALYAKFTINKLLKHKIPPQQEVEEFTDWLKLHESDLGIDSCYRFWAYLRGMYTIILNTGKTEVLPKLHQIHRENLEKGYLFYQGKLSPSAYKNVTFIANAAKHHDWAMWFVETYKDQIIGENETMGFYKFNLASCYFEKKAFEKALDILPVTSSYSDYNISGKVLEIKLYYELNSELLPYKIDAFKMYVHRASKNLLSESKKELLLNFINILQQIYLSPKGGTTRAHQILSRIERKKAVAEKTWLREKVQDLL